MKWIFKGICVALVATAFVFGLGWVTMHLWNWLIPGLTGWGTVDYWHAIGLLILCKILFGGFKGRRGCWGGRCGHGGWRNGRHGEWRKRWEEKMANMSPEEKAKIMAKMDKCGWGGKWDENTPAEENNSKI